jgi:hypothetical protein
LKVIRSVEGCGGTKHKKRFEENSNLTLSEKAKAHIVPLIHVTRANNKSSRYGDQSIPHSKYYFVHE